VVSLWRSKLAANKNKTTHGRKPIVTDSLAHSGGHLLADHLKAVAGLAAEFSGAFDVANTTNRWAYLAGLWHDLGKYRPGFQHYLRQVDKKKRGCDVQ
jgi:HD superfamily phosphohydrolase YqeK